MVCGILVLPGLLDPFQDPSASDRKSRCCILSVPKHRVSRASTLGIVTMEFLRYLTVEFWKPRVSAAQNFDLKTSNLIPRLRALSL